MTLPGSGPLQRTPNTLTLDLLSREIARQGRRLELQPLSSRSFIIYRSLLLTSLSETYLLAGRTDDATHRAQEALRVSCDRGERGVRAHAIRLLGEIAAHRDPAGVAQAEAHYRDAHALATDLGMRPLAAHCHLGLGQLYRRTRDSAKAKEHLTTAATMYREMGMNFWLEKAEAALGPPHTNSP